MPGFPSVMIRTRPGAKNSNSIPFFSYLLIPCRNQFSKETGSGFLIACLPGLPGYSAQGSARRHIIEKNQFKYFFKALGIRLRFKSTLISFFTGIEKSVLHALQRYFSVFSVLLHLLWIAPDPQEGQMLMNLDMRNPWIPPIIRNENSHFWISNFGYSLFRIVDYYGFFMCFFMGQRLFESLNLLF